MRVFDNFDTGSRWWHFKMVLVPQPWEGWVPFIRETVRA